MVDSKYFVFLFADFFDTFFEEFMFCVTKDWHLLVGIYFLNN